MGLSGGSLGRGNQRYPHLISVIGKSIVEARGRERGWDGGAGEQVLDRLALVQELLQTGELMLLKQRPTGEEKPRPTGRPTSGAGAWAG